MKNLVGTVFLLVAITMTVLMILAIWGIYPLSFLNFGRGILTLVILGGASLVFLAIWAMFFWKGNEGPRPGEKSNRKSDIL